MLEDPCSANVQTRVLVVDDHRTFADLLALALAGQPDLECVGIAMTAQAARVLAESQRPDVVVMDVRLGDDDGLTLTSELTTCFPELRVVVLTAHATSSLLERAADVRACCLLPKDGSLQEVLSGIRTARRGGLVVHPLLMRALMAGRPRDVVNAPDLTHREKEVLHQLAMGKDARAIARDLGISLHTCRGHVRSLLHKLDAHTQLEAVANAVRAGLLRGTRQG